MSLFVTRFVPLDLVPDLDPHSEKLLDPDLDPDLQKINENPLP